MRWVSFVYKLSLKYEPFCHKTQKTPLFRKCRILRRNTIWGSCSTGESKQLLYTNFPKNMSRFATKPKKHPYIENAAFLDKILYREVVALEKANNSCIQTFPKI